LSSPFLAARKYPSILGSSFVVFYKVRWHGRGRYPIYILVR